MPINMKPKSNATPEEFSQRAMEKYMLGVFKSPTKRTSIRARPVPLPNLIDRRKFSPESLPQEKFYLRRNTSWPNILEFSCAGTRDKFGVGRFNLETPRGSVGPDHGVIFLREQGEAGSKTLPIIQLHRRKRMPEIKDPVVSRELRDRDLGISAIREQGRVGHRKRGIPYPPI